MPDDSTETTRVPPGIAIKFPISFELDSRHSHSKRLDERFDWINPASFKTRLHVGDINICMLPHLAIGRLGDRLNKYQLHDFELLIVIDQSAYPVWIGRDGPQTILSPQFVKRESSALVQSLHFRKLSKFRTKSSEEAPREQTNQHGQSSPGGELATSTSDIQNRALSESAVSLSGQSDSTIAGDISQPRRNSETEAGPLGLNVVYTPENGGKADIVFIHGLGGTSRLTWSKNKSPELFWPLTFLPLEPDLCLARILTFGYNANFLRSGNVSTSILDFAKALLFDLKYAKDEAVNDLGMGNMVLEKDSSVLGYPGEISKALDADHHGVCKFESPRDPNYVTVRNVLKSLMSKIISKSKPLAAASDRGQLKQARSFLGLNTLPAADYNFFHDQWIQGTCNWILGDTRFTDWVEGRSPGHSILWLNGGPATGKSVLSSFVVNYLVEQGACCSYFYFRFGDKAKRSLSSLFRSIAYQICETNQQFLSDILDLKDEGNDLVSLEPRTLWISLFKSTLFKTKVRYPLYWIIDGLDEAADPRGLLKFIHDLPSSLVPIRIMITSRKTPEIAGAVSRMPDNLFLGEITTDSRSADLSHYVTQELTLSVPAEMKQNLISKILERAQNNFLWVRLAVEKLNTCHRLAEVEDVLKQLPSGMEELYSRMALSIPNDPADNALAALGQEIAELLDIEKSIIELCGGFVVIDNDGKLSMVHQTAREYLLDRSSDHFTVDYTSAHEMLFASCVRCLLSGGLRAKLLRGSPPDLLNYAAASWGTHLIASSTKSDHISAVLRRFLTSPAVLTWIQYLASENQLRVLVLSSKQLSKYASKQQRLGSPDNEKSQGMMNNALFENWAIDMIKLTGKFGLALTQDPESIHKLIPPFCPHNSSIYQQFGGSEARDLKISGISTLDWDDSLSRLSPECGKFMSSISAIGSRIAMLCTAGSISIYDSTIFEETRISPINHGERVYRIVMDRTASIMVTYGYKTTKVWELSSGKCKLSVKSVNSRPRPLVMLLTDSNKTLLVGFDDRKLRSLDISVSDPTWELAAELEEPELEGHFLNASSYMALNEDGTLIAVAYRGHPLSAWEVEGPVHLGHCWRKRDQLARGDVTQALWIPQTAEVLGLYIEGVVFKWNPYDDYVDEISTAASRLALCSDGRMFATGDVHGIVKLYDCSDFSLLYQLSSQDSVLDLAFSPDSRRIYDLRGHYGNVWEPSILLKHAESSSRMFEDDNDTGSHAPSSRVTAMRNFQRVDSITMVSASPRGKLFCYGTETGTIYLHGANKGRISTLHTSKGSLSLVGLTWSEDGQVVAFVDSSLKVYIMLIHFDNGSFDDTIRAKSEISMKDFIQGAIRQVILHSGFLLIFTHSVVYVVSTETREIQNSFQLRSTSPARWIIHPGVDNHVLGFEQTVVHCLDWRSGCLSEHYYQCEDKRKVTESTLMAGSVDQVLITADKKHILVEITAKDQSRKTRQHLHFETSSLVNHVMDDGGEANPHDRKTILATALPDDLSSRIHGILSFLSQDRLVFLSTDFSICSWRITSWMNKAPTRAIPGLGSSRGENSLSLQSNRSLHNVHGSPIKRFFSLPSDWISRDSLSLSTLWAAERSYLCPRNGEVAIVKCVSLV
ncbi:NACHT and WD domain protein [Xylariaceae sp. FL0255]|nr:NACHT and WD domain protein [Xylariaceae sp. FL0255]